MERGANTRRALDRGVGLGRRCRDPGRPEGVRGPRRARHHRDHRDHRSEHRRRRRDPRGPAARSSSPRCAAVVADIGVDAVKVGMLGTRETTTPSSGRSARWRRSRSSSIPSWSPRAGRSCSTTPRARGPDRAGLLPLATRADPEPPRGPVARRGRRGCDPGRTGRRHPPPRARRRDRHRRACRRDRPARRRRRAAARYRGRSIPTVRRTAPAAPTARRLGGAARDRLPAPRRPRSRPAGAPATRSARGLRDVGRGPGAGRRAGDRRPATASSADIIAA